MKQVKIGLNGFGRIGRAITRIASEKDFLSIEAINTSKTTPDLLAYGLKYDSAYRTFAKNITHDESSLSIDSHRITCYQHRNPEEVPWGNHDIDIVIDCTGVFKTREDLSKHLRDSVKKVILTVPSDDASIKHVVMGANHHEFDWENADIISNASCTTNCAAMMTKVLDDAFGIESGFIATIHAYTSSQPIVDDPTAKLTRGRAGALSIIPTTTGASKAVCMVMDNMQQTQLGGVAFRVPVPVGSLTDFTCVLKRPTTKEEINEAFKARSESDLRGFLGYETMPLVSSDYIGNPNSCTFDANYTAVLNGTLVKIVGWYDNEWGYSARIVDIVGEFSQRMS